MKHGKCVALLFLTLMLPSAMLLSACSSDQSKLEPLAKQLHEAVDRCLSDVRDRGVKYETSQYCRALTKPAQQYIEAGGLREDAGCRADRIAENARARAWMALAVSKSGDPRLSIW
jgi:hypothetical protein